MLREQLDRAVFQWSTLGVAFDTAPVGSAGHDIDLERLLLETARLAPAMPRLFVMAVTWLQVYGDALA